MTPEQRKRAGAAVAARIREMHWTVRKVATDAGVGEATLRRLMAGRTWPQQHTRDRIGSAIGWPPGEIARRATADGETDFQEWMRTVPISVLLDEIARRCA